MEIPYTPPLVTSPLFLLLYFCNLNIHLKTKKHLSVSFILCWISLWLLLVEFISTTLVRPPSGSKFILFLPRSTRGYFAIILYNRFYFLKNKWFLYNLRNIIIKPYWEEKPSTVYVIGFLPIKYLFRTGTYACMRVYMHTCVNKEPESCAQKTDNFVNFITSGAITSALCYFGIVFFFTNNTPSRPLVV